MGIGLRKISFFKEFPSGEGLRQGDPWRLQVLGIIRLCLPSPFLFLGSHSFFLFLPCENLVEWLEEKPLFLPKFSRSFMLLCQTILSLQQFVDIFQFSFLIGFMVFDSICLRQQMLSPVSEVTCIQILGQFSAL